MAVQLASSSWIWELEQLTRLSRRRPDLVSEALRRLLAKNAELHWALVVGAYLDRQINLGRAAELLGLHEFELRDRFLKLGVPLRVGPADSAEAQAEIEAMRSWFSSSRQGPTT